MESCWLVIIVCFCLCMLLLKSLNPRNLPPGPLHLPIISNILKLRTSFSKLEPILRNLHAKHGPIITFHFVSGPNIFIADHALAHEALVQNGVVLADRPKFLSSKNHKSEKLSITTCSYGATWRTLRRNLASTVVHTSRFRSFSGTRKRVLDNLLKRLKTDAEKNGCVMVMEHVRDAMFTLLVYMCFGEAVETQKIQHIKHVQRSLMSGLARFGALTFFPKLASCLFRKRWHELLHLRRAQKHIFSHWVEQRKHVCEKGDSICYVDSLLKLRLPEENRELEEGEVVALCSEFLTGGTDTTSTALEWVMANLVKYSHIQQRVVEEIEKVVGGREKREVKEEDLNKLAYLKAVILEGLRRHPPSHFLVPHEVREDVVLNGYLVPKNGSVNVMVAEIGWDQRVWEDPMAFKPERFLGSEFEGFDIIGRKEIKMMPFGVGRRACPAYNLAMLHLEYFVANLVWNFQWKASNGGSVDLSSKQEFTMVMKHPLQAQIYPR
ncbi:hypothetical protein VNO78_27266 [Psophocarpus tetragonolobus]|uniref:Cytochrome P450 n=1 Tax=Psophocarpus tetragonolobus TaxID=3891 RepID=A0AAN9S0K5_PSOTE